MKIIQNTLEIQKKFSNVSKKIWVGPKKVGSVGFPKTRHFFFWPNSLSKYQVHKANSYQDMYKATSLDHEK